MACNRQRDEGAMLSVTLLAPRSLRRMCALNLASPCAALLLCDPRTSCARDSERRASSGSLLCRISSKSASASAIVVADAAGAGLAALAEPGVGDGEVGGGVTALAGPAAVAGALVLCTCTLAREPSHLQRDTVTGTCTCTRCCLRMAEGLQDQLRRCPTPRRSSLCTASSKRLIKAASMLTCL